MCSNSDFYFFCNANIVSWHAIFKNLSTRIISMDDVDLQIFVKCADLGNTLAQLSLGAHRVFNLNDRIGGDFMVYISTKEEGHTGRYVQSLVDIFKVEQEDF